MKIYLSIALTVIVTIAMERMLFHRTGNSQIGDSEVNSSCKKCSSSENVISQKNPGAFQTETENAYSSFSDKFSFYDLTTRSLPEAFNQCLKQESNYYKKKMLVDFFEIVGQNGAVDLDPYLSQIKEDRGLYSIALSSAVLGLVKYDHKTAVNYLENEPDVGLKKAVYSKVLPELALKDPIQAINLAGAQNLGGDRYEVLSSIMANWIDTDLAESQVWAENLPLNEEGSETRDIWLRSLTNEHPELVAEYLNNDSFAVNDRLELGVALAENWAKRDPLSAAGLLDSGAFDNLEEKQLLTEVIANQWMHKDANAAFAWSEEAYREFDKGGETNVQFDSYVSAITSKWMNDYPSEVADWIEDNPNHSHSQLIVADLVTSWSQQDKHQSQQWMKNLPDGELFNKAVESLILEDTGGDLSKVNTFLEKIEDSELKQRISNGLGRLDLFTDPAFTE